MYGTGVKRLDSVPRIASGVVLWYRRRDIASYRVQEHWSSIEPNFVKVNDLAKRGTWQETSVVLFYSYSHLFPEGE